jgi:meiotically up-regulated gene 157 (Mug157) protein
VKDGEMARKYGELYAYEVDGLGNSLLIDDANV